MLIGVVDIEHDAFRRFARAEESLSADRAPVRAKDVADVDGLANTNQTGKQYDEKQCVFFHGENEFFQSLQCKSTRYI